MCLTNCLQTNTVRNLFHSLITCLRSMLNIDNHSVGSYIDQHWYWKSTICGHCIEAEYGKRTFTLIDFIFLHVHCKQTLKTLNLCWNAIGVEGTRFLASALQVNTVGKVFYSLIRDSPFSLDTDTHNAESDEERDRWWRSTVFGKSIEIEYGKAVFPFMEKIFPIFMQNRHSQHWILRGTLSAQRE